MRVSAPRPRARLRWAFVSRMFPSAFIEDLRSLNCCCATSRASVRKLWVFSNSLQGTRQPLCYLRCSRNLQVGIPFHSTLAHGAAASRTSLTSPWVLNGASLSFGLSSLLSSPSPPSSGRSQKTHSPEHSVEIGAPRDCAGLLSTVPKSPGPWLFLIFWTVSSFSWADMVSKGVSTSGASFFSPRAHAYNISATMIFVLWISKWKACEILTCLGATETLWRSSSWWSSSPSGYLHLPLLYKFTIPLEHCREMPALYKIILLQVQRKSVKMRCIISLIIM